MAYPLDSTYPIDLYGFQGGHDGGWRDSVDMERSSSQSTSCSIESCYTIGSSSSGYSVATDHSFLDPKLAKHGVFQETPLSPSLPSAHESVAMDQTLAAAGSHLPQGGQELPSTLQLPDPLQPFSTHASLEGAAWDATLVASSWIASQCSFGDEGPPDITNQAVSEAFERRQREGEPEPARLAVQDVLRERLSSHFNSADPSYPVTANILGQAAYQLQTLLEGPVVISICYLAIVSTLAELVKPAMADIDLEMPEPDDHQRGGDSATLPAPADNKDRFRCHHQGCGKGASRQADLERHIRIVHLADAEKPKFQCDYKPCSRHLNPFLRQDHFRDHLRSYHNEDIPRRGNKGDEAWWARRALRGGWWRCSRCLVRVVQADHGWVCSACGNRCEKERQEYRTRMRAPDGSGGGSRRERGKGKRSG